MELSHAGPPWYRLDHDLPMRLDQPKHDILVGHDIPWQPCSLFIWETN